MITISGVCNLPPPLNPENAVLEAINQLANCLHIQENAIAQIQRKINKPTNFLKTPPPPPSTPSKSPNNSYAGTASKATATLAPLPKKSVPLQKKGPLHYVICFQ